jgi:hypothetical protein
MLLIVSMGVICAAALNLTQNTFFSAFSLRSLVDRTSPRSGLDCSSGGIGGGGGGGSVGGKESRRHKGESLSCRIKSGASEQFNEAEYITAIRQMVEKDITASGAKITGGEPTNANGFYYKYSFEKTLGRVELSGKRVGNDYYSLEASLDEIAGKEE